MVSFPTIQCYSPFRELDWRWQRAQDLAAADENYSRQRDDQETGRALHFIRASAQRRPGSPHLTRTYPDLVAAQSLYKSDLKTRLVLEARILTGQSSGEIANATGVPAKVVDTFESLFFNCRDRFGARDWIMFRAVWGRGRQNGLVPDPGAVLRYFAFAGGSAVLDRVSPYLLDGKDYSEVVADLSTENGRREQIVRLAVAVALLPADVDTGIKLQNVMLLLRQHEHQRAKHVAFMTGMAGYVLSEIESAFENAVGRNPIFTPMATLGAAASLLREAG